MGKRVERYVHVGGKVYAPGDELPADVVDLVTNPKVFEPEPTEDDEAAIEADTGATDATSAPAAGGARRRTTAKE